MQEKEDELHTKDKVFLSTNVTFQPTHVSEDGDNILETQPFHPTMDIHDHQRQIQLMP